MIRFWLTCLFILGSYTPVNAATHAIGIETNGESIAYDMNTAGQVAAVVLDQSRNRHAVLFEHGKLTQIGSLGGNESEASHINSHGEIIGSAKRKDSSWGAFLYSREHGMQDLGTLGGTNSHGMALNDLGDAVGFSDLANQEWHAFLLKRGGQLQDLGTLGGKISYASGINHLGQVVGTSTNKIGDRHAFYYDAARGMVDLGTLGGRASYAAAINDKGVVVGASETKNQDWHAFVLDHGHMVDLGLLFGQWDSHATAINNAGHVVGTAKLHDNRLSFVWRDGVMTVHHSGAKGLYLTNAINDAEQVIGATYDRGMIAASMLSSSAPYVDQGWSNLYYRILLAILFAIAAVVLRKRYRGLLGPWRRV
ncbi:putative HAF family extracellular repeat protein [Oxalobacteraceae bacterium GrIS 1.18]